MPKDMQSIQKTNLGSQCVYTVATHKARRSDDDGGLSRGLAIRTIFKTMKLVVLFWGRKIFRDSPCTTVFLHIEGTALHVEITLVAPVLAPRVANDPVETLLS